MAVSWTTDSLLEKMDTMGDHILRSAARVIASQD